MSATLSDSLISVLEAEGAPSVLVRIARERFAGAAVLVDVCDALHGDRSATEFDCVPSLDEQGLGDEDVRVLTWFLARATSCTTLRCVIPCRRSSAGRLRSAPAPAPDPLRPLAASAAIAFWTKGRRCWRARCGRVRACRGWSSWHLLPGRLARRAHESDVLCPLAASGATASRMRALQRWRLCCVSIPAWRR